MSELKEMEHLEEAVNRVFELLTQAMRELIDVEKGITQFKENKTGTRFLKR